MFSTRTLSKTPKPLGRKRRALLPLLLSAFFLLLGAFAFWAGTLRLPDLNSFDDRVVTQSAKIYDRTGKVLLYDLGGSTKRTAVSSEKISKNIKNATVATEDSEFYSHNGINIKSFTRATLVNLKNFEFSQGGSTITQQVVKNSLLTNEKRISRKLKEWVLAVKLERALSKEQILEVYLNESPYGGSMYGVEEATQSFFGKSASDVSLGEAAYIASLPKAPTYYSPYGNHREALEKRKNAVLDKMLALQMIPQNEHDEAVKEKVVFLPPRERGILAPHFVFYVREYIASKYGENILTSGGLKITTSLDYNLQQKSEEIVKRFALENQKKFNASNAATVGIQPKTGEILFMVGSRDYFDKTIDGNFNIALANRQPGSSFKPFVYAAAFEKGYTPDTMLFDVQTEFSTTCDPQGKPLSPNAECYRPENYDHLYRGPVSLRNALAQSINIPAVKLLYLVGLDSAIERARSMGINTLQDKSRYGLTLVLGGGEVSLLDMTSAYGVFANNGERVPPQAVLKIERGNGEVLEENIPSPTKILDENVARLISNILSDNEARTPAFGSNSSLFFPNQDVAVKTGTTNDYRDAWIIGYTPNIVVGSWAGNNDNSPMEKKVAGFIVAPLWHEVVAVALQSSPAEPFEAFAPQDTSLLPAVFRGFWQGGESTFFDKTTGKEATFFTPEDSKEERVLSNVHTILYWIDKNNITSGKPTAPEQDPQFKSWEYVVREWVGNNRVFEGDVLINKSGERGSFEAPLRTKVILFVTGLPQKEQEFGKIFPLSITANTPLKKVEVYVNGKFYVLDESAPFSPSLTLSSSFFHHGINNIRIVGYDFLNTQGDLTSGISLP
ncbi:MAG: PBP1A family penicillin-binding protein [Patescibacteria group bacterium]